jgi:ElaB/YqjD/DUF883 family membrane-anchored ribosome-binding protein
MKEGDMNENSTTGGGNGEQGRARSAQSGTEQVKEHLRAAKDAATDAVRGTTQQARGWTQSKFSELQERVEAEPYRATAWALGIGFVAGVLLTALARSGRR